MYLWLALLFVAQHDMSNMPGMPGMQTKEEPMEASGTSVNPASSPMNMVDFKDRGWTLMFHGVLFATEIQQTGPRGGDKVDSTNWFMGEARHGFGGGTFSVRSMLSLEPLTVTDRR